MPTDAVWIVVTIPKKEHEISLNIKQRRTIRYEDNVVSVNNLKNQSDSSLNNNNNVISTNFKSVEAILDEALKELSIEETAWISSKNEKFYHVYFPLDLYETDVTLNFLQSKGIGVKKDTSIGYIPFGLFFQNEQDSEDEYDDDDAQVEDDVFVTGPTEGVKNKFQVNPDPGKKSGKSGINSFKKMQEDFLKSVTSRLTVAQVVNGVRASAELTFDFVMYAIFAGCIAAAGLLNNSAVDVAAAMMIEPVMATVIAITFGLVIRDPVLTWIGLRSCIISLIICLVVGYIYGAIAFIWMKEWNPPPSGFWPTPEMSVRGEWRTLWYGALQATAAGGAIAVTLLNDNQAALVGVAVASTFLPPFINTGLLWAYATHITVRGHYEKIEPFNYSGQVYFLKKSWRPNTGYEPLHHVDQRWEFIALSGVSMIYTLVNIVCMLGMAYILLRIKEVVPLGSLEPNRKFFTKDIKVARDYNRRMTQASILNPMRNNFRPSSTSHGPEDEMGQQILSEWAQIAGLDPNALLSDKPEAAITRRQTLADILGDVTANDTYQSVTRSAVGVKNLGSETFLRRITEGSLYGRRSSVLPGSQQVFDVESGSKNRRFLSPNYTPNAGSTRRNSRFITSLLHEQSPTMSVSSITNADMSMRRGPLSSTSSIRGTGLRPQEIASSSGRRTSDLLQKSLKDSDHLPFSLWPSPREPLSSTSSAVNVNTSPPVGDINRRLSAVAVGRRASRLANANSPTRHMKKAINESFESE